MVPPPNGLIGVSLGISVCEPLFCLGSELPDIESLARADRRSRVLGREELLLQALGTCLPLPPTPSSLSSPCPTLLPSALEAGSWGWEQAWPPAGGPVRAAVATRSPLGEVTPWGQLAGRLFPLMASATFYTNCFSGRTQWPWIMVPICLRASRLLPLQPCPL